jgi:hypothetical protein
VSNSTSFSTYLCSFVELLLKPMKLMLVVALSLSSAIQYPAQVTAQTKQPPTSKPAQTKKPTFPQRGASRPVFVWSKTPPGLSTIPGRGTGMGSRENCPQIETPLTALVPFKERGLATKQKDNSAPMDVWGLTTAERPTFWFYVPYTKDVANVSAEFVLQDAKENDVYRQAIALPPKSGVMSVPLPSTVAPLQVSKTYRWYFKIHCNQQQTTSYPVQVEGDIQRVSLNPNVAKQLAAATDPREKIAIYAASGIWYDPLNMLAQLRLANPNDVSLVTDWQSILQSIKLQQLATAPLLN